MKFIPSIIATSQSQAQSRFEKIASLSQIIHFDIMDGIFVSQKTLPWYDVIHSKKNYLIEAHLMVQNPKKWVLEHGKKVDTIIAQAEVIEDMENYIHTVQVIKKKVGIALHPQTPVSVIAPYLEHIDHIIILTVIPGAYGGVFIPESLQKISHILSYKRKDTLILEVDGGVSSQTIDVIQQFPIHHAVVGSYLQQSQDPTVDLKTLQDKVHYNGNN